MGKKKKVTKKRALLRLLIILLFLALLAVGSVKMGELIGVTVLGQPEESKTVQVPNVIGGNQKWAEEVLREKGLEIGNVYEIADEERPIGYVVKQSPVEGHSLKRGATVDIWLSKGSKTVTVPDVTTQPRTDMAKYLIEAEGLVYVESGEKNNVVAEGKIIRQKPVGGEIVPEGTEIIVFVSTGPEDGGLVKVPSTIDMTEEEARKALDDAKLIAEVKYVYSSAQKSGVVVEQTPVADTMVSELSSVSLKINKFEDETLTPTPTKPAPTPIVTKSITDGKKEVKIDLSRAEKDTFTVKVVLEGQTVGRKTEYEAKHSRNEGTIVVYVTNAPGAMLRIYFDGKLFSDSILD